MPEESSNSVSVSYPRASLEQLVESLKARLPELAAALPLKQVVLFGSWAKRRATAYSDVDLLVVYTGPPRLDAYKLVWHCIRLRGLEPHVYSEEEAESLAPTLDRMTRDGISLL